MGFATTFKAGQYLTFRLGSQDFAMPADCIRGILPWHDLHSLEVDSVAFSGIAALGGRIFPVVDLIKMLHLPPGPRGLSPHIVVIEMETADGSGLTGFVVDVVSEVVHARERDFSRGKLRSGGRPRTVLLPELVNVKGRS